MLVHLGSEKGKETEREREKEIIKNNKEKIKNGYLIEEANFLKKKKRRGKKISLQWWGQRWKSR